ncbi:MAG: beta-phosphoglucomutase, partial [Actinomycetia bacterium]|nr:beta-phosphoglucomutase [Actinomycetes bacterium]
MNEIAAVIFDLDGVLTDTAEYHYRAWRRLADELGIPFDRAANEAFRGVGRDDCLRLLLGGRTVDDFDELATRKNRYYVESLSALTPDDILPGSTELLAELKAAGIPVAIGSASKNTHTVLRGLGLDDAFDAVIDGTLITCSKPDPEVFTKAAAALGVTPGECLVVEDATAGIEAGLAGGMWTLGIGPLSRVGAAHAVVPSLDGLTWARIRTLIDDGAWTLRRPAGADPDQHLETILTIGNGHIAVRGTTLEGRPGEQPASFMHGVWDDMPVSRSELANLPRWWGMDVWANGARLGADPSRIADAWWSLDLRTGTLTRTLTWTPDDATTIALVDERFCSLDQPHAAAVRLRLAVTRGDASVHVRSGLDVHVDNLGLRHWDLVDQSVDGLTVTTVTRTRATGIELAACAVLRPDESAIESCDADGQPAILASAILSEGQTWQATKYVALASSEERFDRRTRVAEIAATSARAGWDALAAVNRQAWATTWHASDVLIDGDPAAQIAVRYGLFQLLSVAPRLADSSIGAKTLSGFGYRHHIFWDTEIFMLPLFTFTQPDLAARMLGYRWHRLDGARRKAAASGAAGARFPWESAGTGDEVCPVWVENPADPANLIRIWTGDLEMHLGADVT